MRCDAISPPSGPSPYPITDGSSGKSVTAVATDLDLTVSALRSWVMQAAVDAGGGKAGALTSDEKSELAQLRKENRVLKEEREILKKAAAFFAKESR